MKRAPQREALLRACEYDRLQIRLACARADLDHGRASRHTQAAARAATIAQTIFRHVSIGDLLKIAERLLSRK